MAQWTETRALTNDPIEDGMALYRQQSLIVSRKKESCGERLSQLLQEKNILENQLQVKKQQLDDPNSEVMTVLTSEQFKNYVADLRVKSNYYKSRRVDLNDLKVEYSILSRTLEVLRSQEATLSENLDRIETRQGVRGFRETREILEKVSSEKAGTDEEKGRTLEEMSMMVRQLNSKISEKKVTLAPLLRGLNHICIQLVVLQLQSLKHLFLELRPMRQKYQESLPEYEAKKRDYDAHVQKIENTIASVVSVSLFIF